MNRWGLICCVLGICVLIMGCGAKKPVVTELPVPSVEIERQEQKIDPKFAADQELVKKVLAKENIWGQSNPTVLVVRKQSRTLSVFRGTKPVKRYPVVLGHNPRNDKLMQGDKCTPEGVYRVVTQYPHPKWSKFILLNYPTRENWLKFAQAKKRGQIPVEAQIGGDIGIHGTDDELKNLLGENWTEGCIALRNRDVDEIYYLVRPGSLVVIQRK